MQRQNGYYDKEAEWTRQAQIELPLQPLKQWNRIINTYLTTTSVLFQCYRKLAVVNSFVVKKMNLRAKGPRFHLDGGMYYRYVISLTPTLTLCSVTLYVTGALATKSYERDKLGIYTYISDLNYLSLFLYFFNVFIYFLTRYYSV